MSESETFALGLTNNEPLTPGVCEWCGQRCEEVNSCCSLSCEAQNNRLEAAQGRLIVRKLKLWRQYSGKKGTPAEGVWSEITAMVSKFRRNDRIRRENAGIKRRRDAATAAALAKENETPTEKAS